MQSTYFCQISKVFLLECVIVFVDAEKLLLQSVQKKRCIVFLKPFLRTLSELQPEQKTPDITLYNIVRFRQMSNLFTTLFQDIAIKKTHGNKSRVFECLILKSIEKCFYSAKSGVERYLSPLSGNKTTICLPAFSGRFATLIAA